MNELVTKAGGEKTYDVRTYHVNMTQSVLVRLHGTVLRIVHPERNVLRHGVHTDLSLAREPAGLRDQRVYDMRGARVTLRPLNLARRRWWSRKYPICLHILVSSSPDDVSVPSSPGAGVAPLSSRALNRSKSIHTIRYDCSYVWK
jgi:hypothetical protein